MSGPCTTWVSSRHLKGSVSPLRVGVRKDNVVFAWTNKADLWHSLSPVVVLATAGDYYPCICPVDKFEKLVLNNVLLEQTQGGWRWRRIPTGTAAIICIT